MEESVTVGILREIRDEIRNTRQELSQRLDQTNERLDQTNERLDQTNERLDQTNERLGNVEAGVREMAGQQRFVVRWLKALTGRDRRLEADVAELKGRVQILEEKAKG